VNADRVKHGRGSHFVIIGAQRCGTTYLARALGAHPEIAMAQPDRPEPKFFLDDEQVALGIDEYRRRYFFDVGDAWLWGEKSTSYIESPLAATRMAAMLPGSVAIAVLRDPVARAVSNYRFTQQHGFEPLPLEDALRAAATGDRPFDRARFSVSPYDYLRRGRYAEQLEPYVQAFGSERVVVVLFEELVARDDVLADLYRRLRVDARFRPGAPGAAVNATEGEPLAIAAPLERWLRDYYRAPNRRLEDLLGRTIDCWPA
jgi:hypothetical protein